MRKRAVPPSMLSLTLVLTGCVDDMGVEAARRRPIVGGQAEDGYPAVGRITVGNGSCSATLVGPRVVLTAKHCFEDATEASDISFMTGRFGDQFSGRGVEVFYDGTFAVQRGLMRHDIMAVVLDSAPPIAPTGYRRTDLDAERGATIELVGFGVTRADAVDVGRKRSGNATILDVGEEIFLSTRGDGATNCFGDSGGPVFLDGQVAGVIAASGGDPCTNLGLHTRVDHYLHLIEQAQRYDEQDGREGGREDGAWFGGGDEDRNGGAATCQWANDGVCDEPDLCDVGSDGDDCGSLLTAEGDHSPDGDGSGDDDHGDDVCYCDDQCDAFDDCCESCWGGDGDGSDCYCDADCDAFDDCCDSCLGGDGSDCYCDADCDAFDDCCDGCGGGDGGDGSDGGDGGDCYCDADCDAFDDCCDGC